MMIVVSSESEPVTDQLSAYVSINHILILQNAFIYWNRLKMSQSQELNKKFQELKVRLKIFVAF